jgi:hypothetical protein
MTRAQEPAELRPGLPPVELRRVWRTWTTSDDGHLLSFTADGMAWAWGETRDADLYHFRITDTLVSGGTLDDLSFVPRGASWSEVEALAAKGGAA